MESVPSARSLSTISHDFDIPTPHKFSMASSSNISFQVCGETSSGLLLSPTSQSSGRGSSLTSNSVGAPVNFRGYSASSFNEIHQGHPAHGRRTSAGCSILPSMMPTDSFRVSEIAIPEFSAAGDITASPKIPPRPPHRSCSGANIQTSARESYSPTQTPIRGLPTSVGAASVPSLPTSGVSVCGSSTSRWASIF